jgi:hypothetical protein
MALTNTETFIDKYMVVDRTKEGVAITQFYDSMLGVADCLEPYKEGDLKHLIILRRRHSDAVSWRNVDLVPKFQLRFIDDVHGYFEVVPFKDAHDPITFPVPREGELYEAVVARDMEEVYIVLLNDYASMLDSKGLMHDLDPLK